MGQGNSKVPGGKTPGAALGAAAIAISALAIASRLSDAPEAVRWALLICSLGFIGATLRLRRLDARP